MQFYRIGDNRLITLSEICGAREIENDEIENRNQAKYHNITRKVRVLLKYGHYVDLTCEEFAKLWEALEEHP